MWIEGINITGFGIFCRAEISNIPPTLCLFTGDNEAGKSTLLAFIRFMLYGMSKKKSEDGNRYLPLNGGNHGGIIQVRTAQDKSIQVHRDFSSATKSIAVFDEKNRAIEPSVFEDLLAGTNRELYRNVYAFSLQELQNLASLEADQIKSVLYGAAMGAGILALPKAQKTLNDRLAEIFKPTGVLPHLNKKLGEVAEIRRLIEEIQNSLSVSKYDDINNQLKLLDASLRNQVTKLEWAKETLTDVDRAIKHYPDWCRIIEKRKEVEAIADEAELFPDDGLTILEKEISSLKVYSKNLEDAKSNFEKAQSEAGSQLADSVLLQYAKEIEDLRKDLRQSAQCYKEQPQYRNDLNSVEQQLKVEMSKLGDGWDQSRVAKFSDLEKCGQAILEFQSRFTEVLSKRKTCAEMRQECAEELEKLLDDEEHKNNFLQSYGTLPVVPDRNDLQELRNGFQKCEGHITSLEEKRSEFRQDFESLQHLQQQIREMSGTKDALLFVPDLCDDLGKAVSAVRTNRNILSRDRIEQNKENARVANQQVTDARKEQARIGHELLLCDEKLDMLSSQLKQCDSPGLMIDGAVVDEVRRESGALARLRDELDAVLKELESKNAEHLRASDALGVTIPSDCLDEINLNKLKKDIERLVGEIDQGERKLAPLVTKLSVAQNSYSQAAGGVAALEGKISEMSSVLPDSEESLHGQLKQCGQLQDAQADCDRQLTRVAHLEERLNDKSAALKAVTAAAASKKQLQISIQVLIIGLVVGAVVFVAWNQAVGVIVATLGCVAFFMMKNRSAPLAKEGALVRAGSETESLRKEVAQIEEELGSQKQSLDASRKNLRSLSEALMIDGSISSITEKRDAIQRNLDQAKEIKRLTAELNTLEARRQSFESDVKSLQDLVAGIRNRGCQF